MSVSSLDGSSVQQLQPHMHRHHKQPEMAKTAELLGTSADDLEQARKSGQTLSDLAAAKGVSKDDLVASIGQDLQAAQPQLSDPQLTQMATNIADGKRPARGPRVGDSQSGGDRAQSNLASLAGELGVDQGTLLDALDSDGLDVSSLLKQSNYSSSSDLASGLTIDRYV